MLLSRRPLKSVLAAAAALLVAGVGLSVLHAADNGELPMPGSFHQVDGASLYLDCRGTGFPTIMLEAGATGFAETWSWVQADLARDYRVCAYDRAGLGRSSGGGETFDPVESADRLDALLVSAGERGPFLQVGHSLGGALALIYAERYPEHTLGVVMVDPPHPDLLRRIPRPAAEDYRDFASKLRLASQLAPLGIMHALRPFSGAATSLPAEARQVAALVEVSPTHLRRSYDELREWPAVETAFRAALRENRRPLLVLSAGRPTADRSPEFLVAMQAMQRELAGDGAYGVIDGADHYSIILEPKSARTVSQQVRNLIGSVRPPA